MAELNLKEFEEQLKESQAKIEAELKSMPEVPDVGGDVDHFDEETDEAEEYVTNLGIKDVLKNRLADIRLALEKIKKGVYGKCEKCKAPIEVEVLKASPESKYCKQCKQ